MHTGRSYRLSEFLFWTRRKIGWLFILNIIPVFLFQLLKLKWIALPWTVVVLLGTATAFIIGFKNLQTYNRTWEARQVWGAVMSASKSWALMCRDFPAAEDKSREFIYRHLAWLTALRYQLRDHRNWESINKNYNREYRQYYTIPEMETPIETELSKYMSKDELAKILPAKNRATQLLGIQSNALNDLYKDGLIENLRFLEMHKAIREFYSHQGKSERIKNFPYPRQYATINSLFVKLFCLFLPFALLGEFDRLNDSVPGILRGHMVWFVIPISTLIAWVYASLDQVGESTENPFEGSANDIPISQMSRAVEIDIREMLGETDLPPALVPKNNIIL